MLHEAFSAAVFRVPYNQLNCQSPAIMQPSSIWSCHLSFCLHHSHYPLSVLQK